MDVDARNGYPSGRPGPWRVTLVCPMRNEADGIVDTIRRMREVLSEICRAWEVVVVDDGSTDAGPDLVEAIAREDARVRLVRLPGHQGYGCAIRAGLAAARYEIVAYTDADWPCDLMAFQRAFPMLDRADLVVGYRLHRRENPRRWCYSVCYNALIRRLFGVPVRDVNFSFKVFTRRVLDRITLTSRGSFIDAEALVATSAAGFRIEECAVDYLPRRHGQSTLSRWPVIVLIVREMVAYRRKIRAERRRLFAGRPEGIAHRYQHAGWLERLHLRGRWMSCPFGVVESYLPRRGKILDYGCGHGLFAHLLRLRSPDRAVTGYDPDTRKIRSARMSVRREGDVEFTSEDPLASAGNTYDGIVIADVLPYLSVEDGIAVVRRCYAHLKPGGVLLIKDLDHRPRWKFRIACLQEILAVRVFRWTWAKGRLVTFWPSQRFRDVLAALGGEVVESIDLSRGFLHSHILWKATKPVGSGIPSVSLGSGIPSVKFNATDRPDAELSIS